MKKVILFSLLVIVICIRPNQKLNAQNTNTYSVLNKEEQKVMDYIDANMPCLLYTSDAADDIL
jgi:hypothetical protein